MKLNIEVRNLWNRSVRRRAIAWLSTILMLFTMAPVNAEEFAEIPEIITYCGLEEHSHTASCYEDGALVCAIEEHAHGPECYVEPVEDDLPEPIVVKAEPVEPERQAVEVDLVSEKPAPVETPAAGDAEATGEDELSESETVEVDLTPEEDPSADEQADAEADDPDAEADDPEGEDGLSLEDERDVEPKEAEPEETGEAETIEESAEEENIEEALLDEEENTEEVTEEENTEDESAEGADDEETAEVITGEETTEEEKIEEPAEEEPAGEEAAEEETIEEESTGEVTEEAADEAADDEAAAEDDVVPAYPAQDFTGGAVNVAVSAQAPEGALPEGATMRVSRVWDAATLSDIRETVADETVEVKRVAAVDISFYTAEGAEVEPLLPINVSISVANAEDDQSAVVLHVDDAGNVTPVDAEQAEDGVVFSAESFSIYAVAFTVDFHYEGVDYSIPGMSQILLSELIPILNIQNGDALLDVRDVASVEFSDEHLVTVDEVSGLITYNGVADTDVGEKDFLLTSEAPFNTDEKLTVTLTNGEVIEVGVTDAVEEGELVYDIGSNEKLYLSDILSELGVTLDADDESSYFGRGFYRLELTLYGADGSALKTINDYYGNYYGDVYDVVITGLSSIKYGTCGKITVKEYFWTDYDYHAITIGGRDCIYLSQNIDHTYRMLLSDLIESMQIKKDGKILDVKDVQSVSFAGHKVTIQPVTENVEFLNYTSEGLNESISRNVGEHDFLLSSQQSFTNDEIMTFILADGTEFSLLKDAQVYHIGENNTLSLDAILSELGEDKTIVKRGGYNGSSSYYRIYVAVEDENGNTVFCNDNSYFWYQPGNSSYDKEIVDLYKIGEHQSGILKIYQRSDTTGDGWITFSTGRDYIKLYQDNTPVDPTYRRFLSDIINENKIMNGDALMDVNTIASVVFPKRNDITMTKVTVDQSVTNYMGNRETETINKTVVGQDFLFASKNPITNEDQMIFTLKDGKIIRFNAVEHTFTALSKQITLDDIYKTLELTETHNGHILENSGASDGTISISYTAAAGDPDYESKVIIQFENASFPAYFKITDYSTQEEFYINILRGFKEYKDEQFIYSLNDDGQTLTIEKLNPDYRGTEIVISSTSGDIEGETYAVTAIAGSLYGSAFSEDNITKITFANSSPIEVGNRAFNGVHTLKEIATTGTGGIVLSGIRNFSACDGLETAVIKLAEGASFANYSNVFDGNARLESITINGETPIEVKDSIFSNCKMLRKVTINCGITQVDRMAFSETALEELRAGGNTETIICENAFTYNSTLKYINIEGGIASINASAFDEHSGGYIQIDCHVTEIMAHAFGERSAKVIEFTQGVEKIDALAFNTDSEEEKIIYFDASTGGTQVADGAFKENNGKLSIYFNMSETEVSGADKIECEAHFNEDALNPIYINTANKGKDQDGSEGKPYGTYEAAVAHMTTNIGSDLNKKLTAIGAPSVSFTGVKAPENGFSVNIVGGENGAEIPENAFKDVAVLKSVTSDCVTSIGENAFSGCTGLIEVNLGADGANGGKDISIDKNAFAGCTGLASTVMVRQTVESDAGTVVLEASKPLGAALVKADAREDAAIETRAAAYYVAYSEYELEHFDLKLIAPNGAEVSAAADVTLPVSIPKGAMSVAVFHNANGTAQPIIPEYDTGDDGITALTFHADSFSPFAIGYATVAYHDNQFWYALNINDPEHIEATITGLYDENATEITIGKTTDDDKNYTVVAVQADALAGNSTITSITFNNDAALKVNEHAFQGMTALETVAFNGESLSISGKEAFADCAKLTSVTGIGRVSFDGEGTFSGCAALKRVEIKNIANIAKDTFKDNATPFTVEAERIGNIAAEGFNGAALSLLRVTGAESPAVESKGVVGNTENLTLQFDGGVTQAYPGDAFGVNEGHTLTYKTENTAAIDICENAFKNSALTAVDISGPVGTIGENAFADCAALKTLSFPGAVNTVGSYAFNNCAALESVTFNGAVGTVEHHAFDNVPKLDRVIFLGRVDEVKGYAFRASSMRVAVFKAGAGKLNDYAFAYSSYSDEPFSQENSLIYVSDVDTLGGRAFRSDDKAGKVYFNISYDALKAALGDKSPYDVLKIDRYYYSNASYDADVWISERAYSNDNGGKTDPWRSFSSAMGGMYYRTNDKDLFDADCEAAGVGGLGLVFDYYMKPDFDGFVLHVMPGNSNERRFVQDVPTVSFPEDMYGSYVYGSSYLSDAPETYEYLKGIVFEANVETINIPDGAMQKFPNLQYVKVLNEDAVVTIGKDAFKGTKVDNICAAQQTVASDAGSVTFEKGANAPIGTALVLADAEADKDADVIAAAKQAGLFEAADDDSIKLKYFRLSLSAPNGDGVDKAAHVVLSQWLSVFTGDNAIKPLEFGFFRVGDAVELAAKTFDDKTTGKIGISFDAEGYGVFAAAYTLDASVASDGVYTYLVNTKGEAVVTGYDTGFKGNIIDLPDETEIGGVKYAVIGVKAEALTNPPEGIEITAIKFNNTRDITVGSKAFANLTKVTSVEFAGEGVVQFDDGTAFAGIGASGVSVKLNDGFKLKTCDGTIGEAFGGMAEGSAALTVESAAPIAIPVGAFKGAKWLKSVDIPCGITGPEASSSSFSRNDYVNVAIGERAFEGAANLERFTAGNSGTLLVGNAAFKDCAKLSEFAGGSAIRGIGERAFENTGFDRLVLDTDNANIGPYAFDRCAKLKRVEVAGTLNKMGRYAFGGEGDDVTRLEALVFDGVISSSHLFPVVRADDLKALIFKAGGEQLSDGFCFTVDDAVSNEEMLVYIGQRPGKEGYDPYITPDAFPSNRVVRVYLNIDTPKAEATQSRGLWNDPDAVKEVGYAHDMSLEDVYVDTGVDPNADQDGSKHAPFSSFDRAKTAVGEKINKGRIFREYFETAGYTDLEFNEEDLKPETYTLHVVGNDNTTITNAFAGDPQLVGVVIDSKNVVTASESAFEGCVNLETLSVSANNKAEIGKSAFKGCTALAEVTVPFANLFVVDELAFEGCTALTGLTVNATSRFRPEAFKGCAAMKTLEIRGGSSVTVEEKAFAGLTRLSEISLKNYGDTTIEATAFADCGALEKVLLTSGKPATIKADAFKGDDINVLRLHSGASKVESGAFDSSRTLTSYVDDSKSFDTVLADRIGTFKNIILTDAASIDADAKVFSGNEKLDIVYLGKDTGTDNIGGAIFEGMPSKAVVYVAHRTGEFGDHLPARADGAIRFLDSAEFLYIDGTNTNDNPDGSEQNGFKTFAEAYAKAKENDGEKRGQYESYYYTDLEEVLRNAYTRGEVSYYGGDLRFPVPPNECDYTLFYVIGTVTVKGGEPVEWSGDGLKRPMILIRGKDFNGRMVQVDGGTLTLRNITLDGGNFPTSNAVIGLDGGILNIQDGAVICNNMRTSDAYPDGAGGVYASGTVNMTGGEISGNTGLYGGGIEIVGSASVFNMSGGVIKDNIANGGEDGFGGGVLVASGAKMMLTPPKTTVNTASRAKKRLAAAAKLEVATISGNKAVNPPSSFYGAGGGGIAVGGGVSGLCQGAKLTMTGGIIDGNSAVNNGGGISVQDNCEADISGGSITNNHASDGMFGGGGIYVNGKREVKDGVLKLKNALITENEAGEEGGGLAGCSTSDSTVYYIDGGAIYSNKIEESDYSDVYVSLSMVPQTANGHGMKGHLTSRMFNGAPYNWTDVYADNALVTDAQLADIHELAHGSDIGLKANPDDTKPTTADVIISGNTADTKGGGIGSNGTVVIGTAPEAQKLTWKPEADKILYNRNMKEGETFTFKVYEEKAETFDQWWKRYNDVELDCTGSVTGAEDGVAKPIEFTKAIDLGDYTAADIGKTRTFLIVEDAPADSKVIAAAKYIAITVVVASTWEDGADGEPGKEILSAEVQNIEIGRINSDGTLDFDNVFNGKIIEAATAAENYGRIRTEVQKAVFENVYDEIEISAQKAWLNFDGKTPKAIPPQNASATFELYADDEATGKIVSLDGKIDEGLSATSTSNGEYAPWVATFKNLPVYQTDEDGKLVTDADGEYVKIQYTVVETDWSPKEDYKPDYGVDENGEKKTSVEVDSKTVGEIKNVETGVPEIALPETGGHGTAGLYIAGGMLILLGLALLIAKRRRTND